ncbi:hypothetical protein QTP88_007429 [Uroleucon formosanum]
MYSAPLMVVSAIIYTTKSYNITNVQCHNGNDGVLYSTHDRACSGGGPDARSVNGRVIYCSLRVLQVAVLSLNLRRGDGKHYNIVGRKKKIHLPLQNYAYIGVNRPRRYLPI